MFLPKPPSDAEKHNYLNPNGLLFSIAGLLLLISFSASSLFFIRKGIFIIPYLIFCLIYILNTGFSSIGSLFAKKFNIEEHNKQRELNKEYFPSVDVYLPNCGEDIKILSNTFKAVSQLDYPKYNAWVLDDAGRDEVKILAEIHGFEYIARTDKGFLKKAGNMRNAFNITTGEFIFVLDADFVPRPDFLKETIFYMEDGTVGIIQTPQYFQVEESQTDIQKGSTYLQEVFHRLIQNFRNEWGASVCTGSCAIYRRKALEPFGGAYPVERSEDVNTGLSVLRTGWKIKYIPLVLSAGLSPDTVKSFFHQQYRWCSGSLHLITTPLFWQQSNVGLLGKLSYCLSIFYYLSSGFGTILFNLPSLVNVWFYPESFTITNYSLITPGLITCLLMRGFWGKNKWSFNVALTSFAAGYCHLTAILDVLTNNVAPWIPTGSVNTVVLKKDNFKKFQNLLLVIPMVNVALFFGGVYYHKDYIPSDYFQLMPIAMWYSIQLWLQYFVIKQIIKETKV